MNFDKYFDKVYDDSKYNCAHFACEVWKDLTGDDLSRPLTGALEGWGMRRLRAHTLKVLKPLRAPQAPCLALFQAGHRNPHVGIFIDNKILHLTENGVNWSSVENVMLSFNRVRFYNVEKNNNC